MKNSIRIGYRYGGYIYIVWHTHMHACTCKCVRACMHACVRACVCVHAPSLSRRILCTKHLYGQHLENCVLLLLQFWLWLLSINYIKCHPNQIPHPFLGGDTLIYFSPVMSGTSKLASHPWLLLLFPLSSKWSWAWVSSWKHPSWFFPAVGCSPFAWWVTSP